jgi:exonuclease SbcC
LDSLGTESDNSLAELQGLKVQELAKIDALRNLSKVKALGAEGVCPTCERPLEGQSDLLIRKYELEVSQAEKDIANHQAKVQNQREKIDGVTKSRSGLKKAFDELNAKKSRRSELQAGLRSLEVQISETRSELSDIVQRIEALGDVLFDPQRLSEIDAALKRLAPLAEECSSLVVRLEDLPHKEEEKDALQKERESLAGKCALFAEQIRALGYAQSDYADVRRRFAELKPLHDQFVFLKQKVLEIPGLEGKIAQQRSELKGLSESLLRTQDKPGIAWFRLFRIRIPAFGAKEPLKSRGGCAKDPAEAGSRARDPKEAAGCNRDTGSSREGDCLC